MSKKSKTVDSLDVANYLRKKFPGCNIYDNGFMTRPPHIPPYLPDDVLTGVAAEASELRIRKEMARNGSEHAEIKIAYSRGHNFESVKLQMVYLPTVVHLGGKEIEWNSHEGESIQTYMRVFGIACGLIGISGVAGGGDGAMAMAQKNHIEGIEIAKRKGFKRLFAKSGVCSILLAIKEEAPNNWVTEEWLVRPTRSLSVRKARLFSCGIPVLAQFFSGGDATFDEFDYWKTGIKDVLVEQLDSPFKYVQPEAVFIDPPRSDKNKPECWDSFLKGYQYRMITGSKERKDRKKIEFQKLMRGYRVVKPHDYESAFIAVNNSFSLMEPQAEKIYGASFIETWELINQVSFWKTVENLTHENPFRRKV